MSWEDLLPRLGQSSGIAEFAQTLANSRSANRQNDAQTQVLGAQFQALQAKATRKQEFDRRVAAVTSETNPSRQTKLISDLLMEFPEEKDAIKAGWDVKDEGAKRADLGWLGETVAAFDANRPDLALASLQRRRAADAAAGLDTSTDDSWIDAVKSNDKKAIAYVRGAMLGHIGAVDPDRFAQNYKTAAEPGSPFTLSPGQERRDPITGEVTAKAAFAPRMIPVTQADGSVNYVEYQPGGGDLGSVAPGGAPVPPGDVVARMLPITIKSEGGGTLSNPAVSPKGARGPMQVMPSTGRDPGYGIQPSDGTAADDARVGREYLGKMYQVYSDPAKAWAAYNAGPGRVDKAIEANGSNWLSAMPAETRKYVAKNMAALNNTVSVTGAPQSSTRVIATGAPKPGSGGQVDPVADADAIDNDAEAMIQNGLRMPPGSSRNQAWVMAVKNRAAAIMKERNISPQEAMRGGQDFKAAQVMISGMASTKPGTPGGITRSINVSIDHLAQLKQALTALQTGDVPAFNKFSQWWQRNTGSPLPTNAEALRTVVSGEINKAIIGGAGALADRQDLQGQLSTASSPAQIAGIVDSYAKLMAAQGQGIRRQYEVTTGRKDFGRYLSPRTARLLGMNGPQGGAPPVRVRSIQEANALKPGTRYVRPDGQVMTR